MSLESDDQNLDQSLVTETVDEEKENLNQALESGDDVQDATNETTTDTEQDNNGDEGENSENDAESEGKPKEEVKPEKTPEQIENDRKAERAKFAKIESENARMAAELKAKEEAENIYRELSSAKSEEDIVEVFRKSELLNDAGKYERLRPHLSKLNPTYNNYDHITLVQEVENAVKQKASTDPKQMDTYLRIQAERQAQQAKVEIERVQLRAELKTAVALEVPEFREAVKTNSQLADRQYEYALETAYAKGRMLQELGENFNLVDLISEALYSLPSYAAQRSKTVKAKTQTEKNLKETLKGAGTSTTSTSIQDKGLTPADKEMYDYLVGFYSKRGYSEVEAKKKAMSEVKNTQ